MSRRLFVITCAAMFVFGIVLGLPGAVLGVPDVASRLDVSLTTRGTLISSLFLGLLAGSAISGPIVDRFGQQRVLAAASACVAACLAAFGLAQSAPVAGAALVALGVSCAGINTAANALVSEWFPTSRAQRMNSVSVAVGAGGLLLAAASALSAGGLPWQTIVGGSAILALAVGGAAARFSSPRRTAPLDDARGALSQGRRAEAPRREVKVNPLRLSGAAARDRLFPMELRQRDFALLGVALMLSAANEASMAGWTSAYLVSRGFSPVSATWGLTAHWAGLIVGRSVLGHRVERRKPQAVQWVTLAAAAGVLLMVVVPQRAVVFMLPALIGGAISIVTPTLLALAGDRYPQLGGAVFGLLLTVAQAGAMIAPAAIGAVAERSSVGGGLSVLIATSLGIAWLMHRRSAAENASISRRARDARQ